MWQMGIVLTVFQFFSDFCPFSYQVHTSFAKILLMVLHVVPLSHFFVWCCVGPTVLLLLSEWSMKRQTSWVIASL